VGILDSWRVERGGGARGEATWRVSKHTHGRMLSTAGISTSPSPSALCTPHLHRQPSDQVKGASTHYPTARPPEADRPKALSIKIGCLRVFGVGELTLSQAEGGWGCKR
jgi:hypothetical protein